jgi:argininosuccinate lyase
VYRSRTGESLDKDAFEFLSSAEADSHLLYYDILGSEAHVIMLYEIGFLAPSDLGRLLCGLERIRENPIILSTEKFEDIHECVEAQLISELGYGVGGTLQTARSRNDQVILDIRMMVRDFTNNISREVIRFVSALLSKSKDNLHSIMPMYTHLQQAQVGTFSHFLLSYVDTLFRDLDRLNGMYDRINYSPLGACAIGGTSININRKRTASLLGFKGVINNSIDATSSRDDLIEFESTLSILMLNLSRIAEDFILWSTTEFGYIEIPDKYSSTSSLMPQKKNPDTLELIRAKTSVVSSNLFATMSILKGLPSGYSRDLQEIKPGIINSSYIVLDSLVILAGLVVNLKINNKRMREAADNSYAISVDIAERLVIEKRISFRSAHIIVGALVKSAVAQGNIPLSKLTEHEIHSVLDKMDFQIEPVELIAIIQDMTPERSTESRLSLGSPSIQQQQDEISLREEKKRRYEEQISERESNVASAFSCLSQIVKNYTRVEQGGQTGLSH